MNTEDFKHKITVSVRFHEVDMLGVCNNAVFINYFEQGRLEYLEAIGLVPQQGIFADGRVFFMVHNEINYLAHAKYRDALSIYSKISYIKNSSFGFDHLIVNEYTKQVIVNGKGVMVFVDPHTGRSTNLPEEFYKIVTTYEKNVNVIRES